MKAVHSLGVFLIQIRLLGVYTWGKPPHDQCQVLSAGRPQVKYRGPKRALGPVREYHLRELPGVVS